MFGTKIELPVSILLEETRFLLHRARPSSLFYRLEKVLKAPGNGHTRGTSRRLSPAKNRASPRWSPSKYLDRCNPNSRYSRLTTSGSLPRRSLSHYGSHRSPISQSSFQQSLILFMPHLDRALLWVWQRKWVSAGNTERGVHFHPIVADRTFLPERRRTGRTDPVQPFDDHFAFYAMPFDLAFQPGGRALLSHLYDAIQF
jgi:hypothetical protein